uniref:AB hydrolase-1 domain-containing protein n=1 Tax=Picea sitchensis TaxID=3332 RepID=A9NVT6_PICSI|nr:unknown [Picea sitchensis]
MSSTRVKMRGLFGFSIVEFIRKRKRAQWISLGLKSKQIQLSNDTSLHCWVLQNKPHSLENQRPTLLLIHGFGADGLNGWDTQICALGKHFDLLIPDLIFFGDSTTTSSERTELFQAECMKNMVEYLGVESVIVVGHSYGGFVAFWMAHKYPNVVRRLVIVSSAVCMTPSTNDSLLKEFESSDIKDLLLPNNARDLKISLSISFYKLPWIPAFIYEDLLQATERNRELKTQLADGIIIGSKNSQALPTVSQDVLIVWGEKDRIFRLEEAYALQRHIGEKAKLVVIKECGHALPLQKPTELKQTILKFLQLDN